MIPKPSLSNLISCAASINHHMDKFQFHYNMFNLLLQSLDVQLAKLRESGNLNISIKIINDKIQLYNGDKQIYLTESCSDD